MDSFSDISDNDINDEQDNSDDDFDIENYRDEIESDDSENRLSEENKDDHGKEDSQDESEEQEESECSSTVQEGDRPDRKFVCIKYPGNVVNPENAIRTLGGISTISTAVNTPNRRLELKFRPDDGYCKPTCGDRINTTSFLLRVRVKKSRMKQVQEATGERNVEKSNSNGGLNSNDSGNDDKNDAACSGRVSLDKIPPTGSTNASLNKQDSFLTDLVDQIENCTVTSKSKLNDINQDKDSDETIQRLSNMSNDTEKDKKNVRPTFDRNKYEDLSQDKDYELPKLKILGRIETEFQFNNLCDFQYLPMTQCKKNPKKLECIYDSIYPTGIPPYSWLKKDVPYFLPPAAFTRIDSVQQYVPKTQTDSLPENIIGKSKKRKKGFTNCINFTTPKVPSESPAGIETAMKVKFLQSAHLEQIRKIFEERPIWSRNAVVYKTKFSSEQLKILLPAVAYYFTNGPWRIMWVRLGYDPRIDVMSRKYQTLDYRLKAMRGLSSTISRKRNSSEYSLPYKCTSMPKQRPTILSANLNQEQNPKKERHLNEDVYIYKEGMVPPSRQMFYQYCDVHVNEVQQMLAKLPDPLPGAKCHEKMGWLPIEFDVQCREIINKQVRAVLRKRMNIPEDHPTTLPRKRKLSLTYKTTIFKRRRLMSNMDAKKPSKSTKNLSESSDEENDAPIRCNDET